MLLPALLFKSTSAIICFYFSLRNRFWKFIQIIFRSLFQTPIILPYKYKSQKHTTKKTTKIGSLFLFHIKCQIFLFKFDWTNNIACKSICNQNCKFPNESCCVYNDRNHIKQRDDWNIVKEKEKWPCEKWTFDYFCTIVAFL